MRTKTQMEKLSVAVCFFLRHRPEEIGLTLTEDGYVDINLLIQGINAQGKFGVVTREEIQTIVAQDSKQRYSILGEMIRCNQGHSTPQVDIQFPVRTPPATLYHGTAKENVKSILKAGLKPGTRQYVHLSDNIKTAIETGARHGDAVVIEVDTKSALGHGYRFKQADNGVWLIAFLPSGYLKEI